MNFFNNKPLDGVVGDTTRTSAAQPLAYGGKLSVVVKSDHSSASGSVQVQVSNDPAADGATPVNWANLGSATTISGAGNTVIAQQDMAYGWYRLVYTDSSGGIATAKITTYSYGFSY